MKHLLTLLIVILAAWPSVGVADGVCDEGDQKAGPNCVHEETIPGWTKRRPMGFSTVYRKADGGKVVLWEDQGYVMGSTTDHLVVSHQVLTDDGPRAQKLKCNWNGKGYEPAAKCTVLSK